MFLGVNFISVLLVRPDVILKDVFTLKLFVAAHVSTNVRPEVGLVV